VLAFRALPLVLVVSALSALLFYWRVLPWIVKVFSFLLQKTMGVGGAIGLSSAANVFVGMVEAPLVVRPYIRNMSRGELFILMSCGMATVAGTVMALYASVLSKVVPDALGHILIASIISTPAAIAISVLMVPGRRRPRKGSSCPRPRPRAWTRHPRDRRWDATTRQHSRDAGRAGGAGESRQPDSRAASRGGRGSSHAAARARHRIGASCLDHGHSVAEATTAGALMGTKTVLNELLAYIDLAKLPDLALSPRSRLMMTYALCGFANFGSLGIMIGAWRPWPRSAATRSSPWEGKPSFPERLRPALRARSWVFSMRHQIFR